MRRIDRKSKSFLNHALLIPLLAGLMACGGTGVGPQTSLPTGS